MSRDRYIIRWDDVSPFQKNDNFSLLTDLFTGYGVPALLGVIPDNRDDTIKFEQSDETQFVGRLTELEESGWEVALHGFRHLKHSDDGGLLGLNRASEFAGRPREDQARDIADGMKIMREWGFTPTTFIPPWHSFDENTLSALEENGINILSDGLKLYPFRRDRITFFPVLFWSAPRRLKMLETLGSVYTICLHPNIVTNDMLEPLREFIALKKDRITTPRRLTEESGYQPKRSIYKIIMEVAFQKLYKKK